LPFCIGFETLAPVLDGMPDPVGLTIHGAVARVTLDRPDKRNALRRETIESLRAALKQAQARETRVLVFAATGDVFCAGMDLEQMQQRAAGANAAAEFLEDSRVYAALLQEILTLPVPVIAAVQGPVLAGGMGIVCACDIVIAAEDAWFSLPEPARGITAAIVAPLLIHRIGAGPANAMLLAMERVTATDARRRGLCFDVVPREQLDDRVAKLVGSILAGSSSALALTKNHVFDCLASPLSPLLDKAVELSARARESDEAREGLAAFLEKRRPNWQPSAGPQ
jgi:methylglutaconyl-CoA hydratase